MATVDYTALKAETLDVGEDEAVSINHKALIDKILSRYSSEFSLLRETLQNAADAGATTVSIAFESLPSTTVPAPAEGRDGLRHALLHHTIRRLTVSNNGKPFSADDWKRLKRIAEGQPDPESVGAFGVGFYSVFDVTETPFVVSGNESMAFFYKGDTLFTKRIKLTPQQASADTRFILDYRDLKTPVPNLQNLSSFLASSLLFSGLKSVELWLDGWKLLDLQKESSAAITIPVSSALDRRTSDRLMSVASVEQEHHAISAKYMKAVHWNRVETSQGVAQPASQGSSLKSFFSKFASSKNAAAEKAAATERKRQESLLTDLTGTEAESLPFTIHRAKIDTRIGRELEAHLKRATKKTPPLQTRIALLTAEHTERGDSLLSTVLPTIGRVFIGFKTNQTMPVQAHLAAHALIPTVERENVDLVSRYIKSWNTELLRAAGITLRIIYDSSVNDLRSHGATPPQEKQIATAMRLAKSFHFVDTTPASQVGSILEEAFWLSRKNASIDLLSTRGVQPASEVRISQETLSFAPGIPLVPKELQETPFIQKLIGLGVISGVLVGDIKKQLEDQTLSASQFMDLLAWLVREASSIDHEAIAGLLRTAVISDEASGKVCMAANFTSFVNPAKIPGNLPLPSSTCPFAFTKSLSRNDLLQIGLEELQIVPWLRFCVSNQVSLDLELAGLIMNVLSKQFDSLSQSSKQTVIELLEGKPVIPTSQGLRTPQSSYFPSAKLFDDQPIVQGTLKEKFLLAIGVRKTLELPLIFERLYSKRSDKEPGWSHVDLIRYLTSVANSIPRTEYATLRSTPLCPAEGFPPTQLFKISDIFEPDDELRSLKSLKILSWPSTFNRRGKQEVFLRGLGLRSAPTVVELIDLVSQATSSQDLPLRDLTLRYLTSHAVTNNYSSTTLAASTLQLPLEGSKSTASPSECYTNSANAFLGVPLLRADLVPYASQLGVKANPPIQIAVRWLISHPPSLKDATPIFEYFATRMGDLDAQLSRALAAPIVPIGSEKGQRHLPPHSVFLGQDSGAFENLFTYVQFSPLANSFLLHIGAKQQPSRAEIAALLVHEPARVLQQTGTAEGYLRILTEIAGGLPELRKDKKLLSDMRLSPWLLAFRESANEENESRTFELARPTDIAVVDDPVNFALFRASVLAAPWDDLLEPFYIAMGTPLLSSLIEERPRIGQPLRGQEPAEELKALVCERFKLFVHDLGKEALKRSPSYLEQRLRYQAVSAIKIHKSLRGSNARHVEDVTATAGGDDTLYFVPSRDYFGVALALTSMMLKRPKGSSATVLTVLLEKDLRSLRARGYNVSRILQKRQEEARLAQEQQEKALAAERERLAAVATTQEPPLALPPTKIPNEQTMPGQFPTSDSLEDTPPRQSGTLFDNFSKALQGQGWKMPNFGNSDSRQSTPLPSRPALPAPPGQTGQTSHEGPRSGASAQPADLERTLQSATMASRAHDGDSVVSDAQLRDMEEAPRSYCDSTPAQDLTVIASLLGFKVFVRRSSPDGSTFDRAIFLQQHGAALEAFARMLTELAPALGIPRHSLHIYYVDSESIAFNLRHAIFVNAKYFETLHLASWVHGAPAPALIYWMITICHELAHHLVTEHSAQHSYYTEAFIARNFAAVMTLIAREGVNDSRLIRSGQEPPPRYEEAL